MPLALNLYRNISLCLSTLHILPHTLSSCVLEPIRTHLAPTTGLLPAPVSIGFAFVTASREAYQNCGPHVHRTGREFLLQHEHGAGCPVPCSHVIAAIVQLTTGVTDMSNKAREGTVSLVLFGGNAGKETEFFRVTSHRARPNTPTCPARGQFFEIIKGIQKPFAQNIQLQHTPPRI